ncbi:MAG TPA: diguanylate cyclase [Acidisarcina sp.]
MPKQAAFLAVRLVVFRTAVLTCLIFCFAGDLRALDPAKRIDQYGHDYWTTQHGLPGEAVYQITQSRDGYLWMRTSAGLVRFDGVRFVLMDSAIGAEPVKSLAMGADGDMLVRTTSRTVVYKDGKFTDYRAPAALPDGDVGTIFESRQHEVLLGADDFMYAHDRNGMRLVRQGTAAVTSFLQDETGKIWVGAADNLYIYKAGTLIDGEKLKIPAISSLAEDHDHRLLVGTTRGLFALNRGEGRQRFIRIGPKLIDSVVNTIAEDHSGNLWVGTTSSGLIRIHGDQMSSFASIDGMTDSRVLSVFEDREGSLWVGTGSGLDRFRDTKATTYTTIEGLPSNQVKSAVATPDGSIYVFCDNGGLAQIKGGVVTGTSKIAGLPTFLGSSLYEDRKGVLWLGTIGGLSRLKDGKFTVYNSDHRVVNKFISAIAEDNESLIITTSDTLAFRFKDEKLQPFTIRGETTPLSSPGNYTFTIYRSPNGTLWFGTVKGLFQFAPGQPPARSQVSQINFPVTSISDDGLGSLWLGGRTPGLIRYRMADGRVTHYKKIDGLFDGYPSRVLFDDAGDAWISTSNGIYKANRQDLDDFADGRISTVRAVVYGIVDGMKTSEASNAASQPGGARGVDGKLWFTTPRGIVMIDPRHLIHNALVPPVVIEDVEVDGSGAPSRGHFDIAPGRDKIEFHYTALSLLAPERVRFKYQLVGYDSQWVDAGSRRVAYYNNLPPGNYRFRVMAANNDGVWNFVGASVAFTMKPHFYQTRLFRGMCVLTVVLLAIVGHRLSTRLFRRRAAHLRHLVDERTAELRETQRHLEHVAFFDSLTSLPNRRMLSQEFRKMLASSEREGGRLWLLMVDLDQFKLVNDTMGHDAGDALLVEAALRLKAAVRETDCVARLGGDEFAILVADKREDLSCGELSIDIICQRILDNFASALPYKGSEIRTTPSIGIAVFPEHGMTQEALCKSADLALYQTKRAGGNGWHWYQLELGAGHRALVAEA